MYSQNNEEKIIVDYFAGRTGKFVDIGAYDVFKFSNTRRLYELGWFGVLVEPVPELYEAIKRHYDAEERITVLQVVVGVQDDHIDFYSCQDAVSTSNTEHRDKWAAAGVKYKTIKIDCIDADWFMRQCGQDADFLSIDTEATNIDIFRAMPEWVWKQISMLCIEHDNYQAEIRAKLMEYGFTEILLNAENIIMAK